MQHNDTQHTSKDDLRPSVDLHECVTSLLQDDVLFSDPQHWSIKELRAILDEPSGIFRISGDNRNAFHLWKRLCGFRDLYSAPSKIRLDEWIDNSAQFCRYLQFARSSHDRKGQHWLGVHAALKALELDCEDVAKLMELEKGHLYCASYSVNEAGAAECMRIATEDAKRRAWISTMTGAAEQQVPTLTTCPAWDPVCPHRSASNEHGRLGQGQVRGWGYVRFSFRGPLQVAYVLEFMGSNKWALKSSETSTTAQSTFGRYTEDQLDRKTNVATTGMS